MMQNLLNDIFDFDGRKEEAKKRADAARREYEDARRRAAAEAAREEERRLAEEARIRWERAEAERKRISDEKYGEAMDLMGLPKATNFFGSGNADVVDLSDSSLEDADRRWKAAQEAKFRAAAPTVRNLWTASGAEISSTPPPTNRIVEEGLPVQFMNFLQSDAIQNPDRLRAALDILKYAGRVRWAVAGPVPWAEALGEAAIGHIEGATRRAEEIDEQAGEDAVQLRKMLQELKETRDRLAGRGAGKQEIDNALEKVRKKFGEALERQGLRGVRTSNAIVAESLLSCRAWAGSSFAFSRELLADLGGEWLGRETDIYATGPRDELRRMILKGGRDLRKTQVGDTLRQVLRRIPSVGGEALGENVIQMQATPITDFLIRGKSSDLKVKD